MAEVHRAWAEGAGGFRRLVAIKRLLPAFAEVPALRARFQDEACIGARLHHPGVVAVLGFYEESGRQHLVMEYVDGVSVEHLVQRGYGGFFLSPRIVTFVMLEAARAIAYAHAENVLHRDVSCCNLLVSRAGEVKLADFGLADAPHRVSSTEPGALSGKLAYLSPERSQGEAATPQDDLYALGVVLARLVRAVDPRVRGAPECVTLLSLVSWLTAPRPERAPSAQALAARLRELPHADREELAQFVRDNPQPRRSSAPRLVGSELDDPTDAGARREPTDTTTSHVQLTPTVREALALMPATEKLPVVAPAPVASSTVQLPAFTLAPLPGHAPATQQLPAIVPSPATPETPNPVGRWRVRVVMALLLVAAGFAAGRLIYKPGSTTHSSPYLSPHAKGGQLDTSTQ